MKLSLDIHGVIDAQPHKFITLALSVQRDGGKVYVCTGSSDTLKLRKELLDYANGYPWFDEIFSVTDYLKAQGVPYTDTPDGGIRVDEIIWDKVKGDWAAREEIDLHIDDSPVYGNYFPEGVYLKFSSRDTRNNSENGQDKK